MFHSSGFAPDTPFKQPIAQVRAVGEIAEDDPTCIVGIGILRIERGDHVQGVIDPLIFVFAVSFFPDHLQQPEPEDVGAKMMIAEQGWFQIFALRKLRKTFDLHDRPILPSIEFPLQPAETGQEEDTSQGRAEADSRSVRCDGVRLLRPS